VQQFPTVFDEQIGQLPGELHLDLNPSAQMVQLPVRRMLFTEGETGCGIEEIGIPANH
jgi:hypothetical protein